MQLLHIHNRDPSILPVSTVIQAGIPESLQHPNTEPITEPTTVEEFISPPKIPTISEATQLNDLAIFFQCLSVSTLSAPYTQRQIQVPDMVETVLQARVFW